MTIQDLSGKNVCIVGYGREGRAMAKALETHAPRCTLTIADSNADIQREKDHGSRITYQTGPEYLRNLEKYDVIIVSPGIPPQNLARIADRSSLTTSTQIFLDTIAGSGCTIIGVTGSKGKSTTSTLIYEILKADKRDVHLVGNIGEPAIMHVDDATPDAIFVFEMSSYQLMHLTVSPQIAVVTSFFPEHLDYHGSLENYLEAKTHITRFQTPTDTVFYNANSAGATEIAMESAGTHIGFTAKDAPVTLREIKLIGEHNLNNIAAAFKVASLLQVPRLTAMNVIKKFDGLPHRLQMIGTFDGIDWVDDAISTTPESAIAALKALGNRVNTIILGGQDRGNDFTQLAEELKTCGVRHAILFPGSGPRIRMAIERSRNPRIELCDAASMEEAVNIARKVTESGNICLLSTASPSYGMFKNFEEKGNQFQNCIREP